MIHVCDCPKSEPGFTMTYITCVCARVCVIREMASLDRCNLVDIYYLSAFKI